MPKPALTHKTRDFADSPGRAVLQKGPSEKAILLAIQWVREIQPPFDAVEDLRFERDVTLWTDTQTGTPRSVPTKLIAEVRFKNHRARALNVGGTWGFITGAFFGAVAGYLAGDEDPDEKLFSFSREQNSILFAIVYAPLGWLIGMPVGVVIGVDDIYRFLPEPPAAEQP